MINNFKFVGDNRKVLWQTYVGRKRNLSTYRSKKDIKRKKHKVINQRNTAFNQNFTKIEAASSESDDINILDSDLSSSSDFEDLNVSAHGEGGSTNILTN